MQNNTWMDNCVPPFGEGGFESNAPAPLISGCKPGFVVPGCKTAVRVLQTSAAGGVTFPIGPWQPLRLVAIMDINSGADVTIDDLEVEGESLFTKFNDPSAVVVAGLGLVADLTPGLYEASGNPMPPSPLVSRTSQLVVTHASAAANDLDARLYFGNPLNKSDYDQPKAS